MPSTALVVGVTGVVGLNLAKRLVKEGWIVYGTSRKRPDYLPTEVNHVAVDLTDREGTAKTLAQLSSITHVFFTSWVNKGSEEANCVINKAITENLLDGLTANIKHFALVTGTKHYMGPFEDFASGTMLTPFRERQPRLPNANFYYDQEDVVFDRAEKRGFTWSVARPHSIIGFAPRNQMNLGQSIAVYATICKHLNLPFIYPGGKAGYDIFLDATDTDLLAEHLIWEATNPQCANEAFNVVNGDVFRWRILWPEVANYFGVTVEDPGEQQINMDEFMADKSAVWDEIVEKYGLQKFKLEELTVWWHVNIDLGREVSCPTDMNKSKELGFLAFRDTEKSYFKLFDYLRENKFIP